MNNNNGGYRSTVTIMAMLLLYPSLQGCDPNTAEAGGKTAAKDTRTSTAKKPVKDFHWPTHSPTGKLRQFTKHTEDLELNPGLVLMSGLPNEQMPALDIKPLNIRMILAPRVVELWETGRWALLDVRKQPDVIKHGTIPGAYHIEYNFQYATYNHSNHLTDRDIQSLLSKHDGVIIYCNGPLCSRSFNASVHLVQDLGINPEKVRWFRDGTPAWTATPLIPSARDTPRNTGVTARQP